jgi:hypothetical protein
VQLDEGELRGPVNGDQEIELALSGLHLGDVDSDAVALEAAMQRCSDDRVRFGIVTCKA